ncbi:MAG: HAD family phosphatase [Bacteroidota bacterium]
MIKNIILDFGGVIYAIDHQRTKNAFSDLGLQSFDELYGHTIQTKLFEEFEKGNISPSVFRGEIRKFISKTVSDAELDTAWNALLIDYNLSSLRAISYAKKHYRLFLLSNTNQIHFRHYMAQLEAMNQKETFLNSFSKIYFSHQIGMRKPDLEIYENVLRENNLVADQCLFIDDLNVNIVASRRAGLPAFLLEEGMELASLFTSEGLLKIGG